MRIESHYSESSELVKRQNGTKKQIERFEGMHGLIGVVHISWFNLHKRFCQYMISVVRIQAHLQFIMFVISDLIGFPMNVRKNLAHHLVCHH